MTAELYSLFLMEVSTVLEEEVVMIHDNAPLHRQIDTLYELHDIVPLPRY